MGQRFISLSNMPIFFEQQTDKRMAKDNNWI